ncbi:amidase, partial [Streptomyces sp. MBT57]|nr:amidase [Streptomyces sp. MBT57]
MSSAEPTEQTGPALRPRADRDRVPAPAPMPGLAECARLLADSTTTSTALVADALARI